MKRYLPMQRQRITGPVSVGKDEIEQIHATINSSIAESLKLRDGTEGFRAEIRRAWYPFLAGFGLTALVVAVIGIAEIFMR